MKTEGDGVLLRIFVGESDTWHGKPLYEEIVRRAREQGLDPLAYCDRMEQEFRAAWSRLNISYDDFIRTTQPRHRAAVEKLVTRSREAGDIYEGFYEGWYCVSCEEFKPEKTLEDGLCPIHRTKPDWIKERNYFFRLSAFRDRLLAHYAAHPEFVQPDTRRNEMLEGHHEVDHRNGKSAKSQFSRCVDQRNI